MNASNILDPKSRVKPGHALILERVTHADTNGDLVCGA
jgi:hypothetical protein